MTKSKVLMLIYAGALVLLLSSCAGDGATRSTVGLGVACDSVAQSIKALTPSIANGKLSAAQVDTVVTVRDAAKPLCRSGSGVDPATAYNVVSSFATRLSALKEGLGL